MNRMLYCEKVLLGELSIKEDFVRVLVQLELKNTELKNAIEFLEALENSTYLDTPASNLFLEIYNN